MNVIQNTFRILNINAKVTTWLENHECTEKLTEIQSLGQNFLDIFLTFDRKSLHTFSHIVNNTYISKCQNAVAYILQNIHKKVEKCNDKNVAVKCASAIVRLNDLLQHANDSLIHVRSGDTHTSPYSIRTTKMESVRWLLRGGSCLNDRTRTADSFCFSQKSLWYTYYRA